MNLLNSVVFQWYVAGIFSDVWALGIVAGICWGLFGVFFWTSGYYERKESKDAAFGAATAAVIAGTVGIVFVILLVFWLLPAIVSPEMVAYKHMLRDLAILMKP